MTFIESGTTPPTAGLICAFSILSIVAFLCSVRAFHLGKTRSHYRTLSSARFLFPLACLILAIENAAVAASGLFYQDKVEDNRFVQAIFALQAMEVPILLVVTFELTYLVHKRRGVNFCGMYFDEGRRLNNIITTPMKSFVLRNFIRILAVLLLVMGIMGNFDMLGDISEVNELAGRAGWWALVQDLWSWSEKGHLLLSLLPTAVLVLCCLYFSILLWRYGTECSMVVHSSLLNPWFFPFFGTVALTVGQIFPEQTYPLTSNIGFLVFIITLLLLMAEVDKDMVAADAFVDFLAQVSEKGKDIGVWCVVEEGASAKEEEKIIQGHDEEDEQHSNENVEASTEDLGCSGSGQEAQVAEEEKSEELLNGR